MYQKSQSYDVRLLRCRVRHNKVCHFGPLFAHPNDPENQNFEEMKKKPGDIILLYIHVYHK